VHGSIYVEGEDGDKWRIRFDGNGSYEWEDGETFYGFCAYSEFKKAYWEELPADVKERLEEWWIAKKV